MPTWDIRVRGKAVAFEPKQPTVTLSDTGLVGDAAVVGLGITRMALHVAWPHLQAGRLKLVLMPFNDPGAREMVIHYPHRERVARRMKAFIDFILASLKDEPTLHAALEDAPIYGA